MHHRTYSTTTFFILLCFYGSIVVAAVRCQDFTPQSLSLDVYSDGYVQVIYRLTVNNTVPAITVEVFGANIENLLVLDENDTVLDYSLAGSTLDVYTLGATFATIDYDTPDLTTKLGPIWTVNITSPISFQVKLPAAVTIIDVSSEPLSIQEGNGRLLVEMQPGTQWVSYFQEEPTTTQQTTPPPVSAIPFSWAITIGSIGAAVGVGVAATLLKFGRRPRLRKMLGKGTNLRQEERDVIEYLAERGGAAFEAELRDRFPTISKTSLWRLVKRLEEKGLVRTEKVGSQNRIRRT